MLCKTCTIFRMESEREEFMPRISSSHKEDFLKVKRLHSINYYDLSPDFVTRENTHAYWEFVYVDAGEVQCVMGEENKSVLNEQLNCIRQRLEQLILTIEQ